MLSFILNIVWEYNPNVYLQNSQIFYFKNFKYVNFWIHEQLGSRKPVSLKEISSIISV